MASLAYSSCMWMMVLGVCVSLVVGTDCGKECALCVYHLLGQQSGFSSMVMSLYIVLFIFLKNRQMNNSWIVISKLTVALCGLSTVSRIVLFIQAISQFFFSPESSSFCHSSYKTCKVTFTVFSEHITTQLLAFAILLYFILFCSVFYAVFFSLLTKFPPLFSVFISLLVSIAFFFTFVDSVIPN